MDIVQTFGDIIANDVVENPDRARRLLVAGYRAQLAMLNLHPDKRLPPSRRSVARVAMRQVISALSHPEEAAAISLFVPFEPLLAAGVTPYSVEQLSCFISGTKCEKGFLEISSAEGISETMCSYHRIFLGACASGLMPKPAFTIYTNVACDGNMITFPHLSRTFGIPSFCIDVPYEKNEDSIAEVADQMRTMTSFVAEASGRRISEDNLRRAVAAGWRSALSYRRFLESQRTRRLPSDLTSEMYAVLMTHILLGSPETERFAKMLETESRTAPRSDALRLIWLHAIPNMQQAATERLNFNDDVFISACDLATDPLMIDIDPDDPYDAMARRLVCSAFNGNVDTRVERALELAERTGAAGAVLFGQWGCKATLGASRLIKDALEAAGLPTLLLDGDGADRANASDGQIATRLDAFLEMLRERRP